jgi:hypothetical protein
MENFRGDDGARSSRGRSSDYQMSDDALKEITAIHKRILAHLERCEQICLDYLETLPEYKARVEARKLAIYVEKHPEINLNDPSLPL